VKRPQAVVWLGGVFAVAAALFVLLPLLQSHPDRHGEAGLDGTLVVAVPTRAGLVVASDTRFTALDVYCDGKSKVSIPRRPENSLIAATGTSTWISTHMPLLRNDPCGDIAQNGVTFFDAKAIVTAYLEEKDKPVWQIDLQDLANRLIEAVDNVYALQPDYVRSFAGRTMFQIVLAAYLPAQQMSFVRALELSLSPQFRINAKLTADYKFKQSSAPQWPYFGDTINFDQHVLFGAGNRFLPSSLNDLKRKMSVAEVTDTLAGDVAVGMINAAKKTTEIVPSFKTIGGPTELYALGPEGVVKLQ
jgi:hypothetical protein